ncbi:hypothetical protein ACFFX1_10210 [Dactylosporangium sucinum]|uniref:DUF8175 domain-containing protein n=1 Tax=Dactylosporangium sucinum TaxID=1424081 RepID=A0A917THW6_9ACTN|nr:hypothetical protein [Dactylosporangium sucinum]GGM24049.1 hypothetical protein GCM10007977_026500 [Dactylosporangium sucinum]
MTYDVIARARRSTRRRATAVFLAAAAVAGLVTVVLVSVTGAGQPASAPGATTEPVRSGVPTGAAGDGAADLPGDLTWADVSGVSLPVSSRSGPHATGGGLARGFAHDRGGAVLAAVHILVRTTPQVGPSVFDATLRTQVVGPDADALRVRVAQDYDNLRGVAGVAYGQPLGRLYTTLRGYRITSYIADEATLGLLTEAGDGRSGTVLAASQVRMRWTGSDWALVAPAGGSFDADVTRATQQDIEQFVPFTAGR